MAHKKSIHEADADCTYECMGKHKCEGHSICAVCGEVVCGCDIKYANHMLMCPKCREKAMIEHSQFAGKKSAETESGSESDVVTCDLSQQSHDVVIDCDGEMFSKEAAAIAICNAICNVDSSVQLEQFTRELHEDACKRTNFTLKFSTYNVQLVNRLQSLAFVGKMATPKGE